MLFIFVLLIVTFGLAVAECLAAGHPRMQKQIYYIAFAWVAVWCTLKYAFGPDIANYIPFWDSLVSPMKDLHNSELFFEPGFVVFCSVLKQMGFTFWGMTAVISVLYFMAIALVFRQIKAYRTIGLLVLVMLNYNLMLVELRQCLAVSFFIFCILLFQHKRYLLSAVMAVIAVTLHKSVIVILLCAFVIYLFRFISVTKRGYLMLAILFVLSLFLPIQHYLGRLVDILPLSESLSKSAEHHLLISQVIQRIFILYALTILCLAYYKREESQNKTLHWIIWCTAAALVCFYPYWFLLNRLRSYFLPFIIMYVLNTLYVSDVKDALFKQVYTVVIFINALVTTLPMAREDKNIRYPTGNISLVTERIHHSQQVLMNRQLKQAELYWDYDYDAMIEGGAQ